MLRALVLLALIILTPVGARAEGLTLPRGVASEEVSIPRVIVYSTATSSAACTEGRHGCILSQTFSAVTSATYTSFAPMPYKGRVDTLFFDSGSNGTLVCTSAALTCLDPLGQSRTETYTNLSESGQTSRGVCSKITRLVISGCSGGAASDVIKMVVRGSEVGLSINVPTDADVHAVGYAPSGNPWRTDLTSGWSRVAGGRAIALPSSVLDAGIVTVRAIGRQ